MYYFYITEIMIYTSELLICSLKYLLRVSQQYATYYVKDTERKNTDS